MTNTELLSYIAIGVAGCAVLAFIITFVNLRKIRRQLVAFRGANEEINFVEACANLSAQNDELNAKVQRLTQALVITQRDVAASLRHLAVVRFNAISDMGPQYSFSAAILDDAANGIVITCIQGRDQSRVYSKTIINGTSELSLTPEEQQAIESARPEDQ